LFVAFGIWLYYQANLILYKCWEWKV
jgi:hypothetical protein